MDLILQTLVNATVASSFAAIFAVGLVLIFGVMNVCNFAQGELYMAGAFTVFYVYSTQELPYADNFLSGLKVRDEGARTC